MSKLKTLTAAVLLGLACMAPAARAEITIDLTAPVIEPMPFAIPDFVDEGGAGDYATNIARVVAADLAGTGLFREIPREAHISRITSFGAPVAYQDWQAINAQALITGAVQASGDRIVVKFYLFDVFTGQPRIGQHHVRHRVSVPGDQVDDPGG